MRYSPQWKRSGELTTSSPRVTVADMNAIPITKIQRVAADIADYRREHIRDRRDAAWYAYEAQQEGRITESEVEPLTYAILKALAQ